MKILGIETSCDDTGIAIYDTENHTVEQLLYSQTKLHDKFGGIVPEFASRDHIRKLLPILKQLFQESQIDLDEISGLAYTKGPGLMGSLLVGATFTKSLAWAMKKPCIGVNHLEAHLMAVNLSEPMLDFPFIGLLVSGGHTLLVEVLGLGQYNILGRTLDDAVGECFDKTAKLLGLCYPGGPIISKLAKEGEKNRFRFPKPMLQHENLDFSFSGLKTHIRNLSSQLTMTEQDVRDISYQLENTIVEILTTKTEKAILQSGLKTMVLAGGVAANTELRGSLRLMCDKLKIKFLCPEQQYCTDNGAMVAITGSLYLCNNISDKDLNVNVYPKWDLEKLTGIN